MRDIIRIHLFSVSLVAFVSACAPKPTELQSQDNEDPEELHANIVGGVRPPSIDPIAQSTGAVISHLSNGETSLCSGSILERDVVLTAAHCIHPLTDTMEIVFERVNINEPGVKARQVKDIEVPDLWKESEARKKAQGYGDLALLYFDGGIPSNYRPVEILFEREIKNSATAFIAGYGFTDGVSKSTTNELRMTYVGVQNANYTRTEVKVDQRAGRGACHGDSGGPAYIYHKGKYMFWGVTSRGVDDTNDHCDNFAAYTNVQNYTSWISAAKEEMRNRRLRQNPIGNQAGNQIPVEDQSLSYLSAKIASHSFLH